MAAQSLLQLVGPGVQFLLGKEVRGPLHRPLAVDVIGLQIVGAVLLPDEIPLGLHPPSVAHGLGHIRVGADDRFDPVHSVTSPVSESDTGTI